MKYHQQKTGGGLCITLCPMAKPAPNIGLEPTPYSVRCAPASGRGSPPAFGLSHASRAW